MGIINTVVGVAKNIGTEAAVSAGASVLLTGSIYNALSGVGKSSPIGGSLQFPADLTNRTDISQYTYFAPHEDVSFYNTISPRSTPLGQIYLPLPRELSSSYRSNWETIDAGGVGAFAALGHGDVGAIIESQISKLGGDSATGKFLDLGSKRALNPYKYVQWKGPDFRTFNFTFDLVSSSAEEAETLNKIIWWFKKYVHTPSKALDGVMVQPPLWNIKFVDGKDQVATIQNTNGITDPQIPGLNVSNVGNVGNKYLFQLKDCAITSFDVDYTSKGSSFHGPDASGNGNHAPTNVKLTISFTETAILTQEDFEATYPNRATN